MCIIGSECPERYVKCPTGFECIWYEYMCNGYSNCNDGSDEKMIKLCTRPTVLVVF
jgi:hypothetical protein